MRNFFCVFATDAWKSYTSKRLVTVCTTPRQLKRVLSLGIRRQEFQFDPNAETNPTPAKQAKAFRQSWDEALNKVTEVPYGVIDRVEYCYVETVTPNDYS